jgi:hypothetical protein
VVYIVGSMASTAEVKNGGGKRPLPLRLHGVVLYKLSTGIVIL